MAAAPPPLTEVEDILDAIKDSVKKILAPPLGTQNITTEVGTRELLAMLVYLNALAQSHENTP